jgi:hypothetical protein
MCEVRRRLISSTQGIVSTRMCTHAAGQVGLLISFGTTWHLAYVHSLLLSSNQGNAAICPCASASAKQLASCNRQAGSVLVVQHLRCIDA